MEVTGTIWPKQYANVITRHEQKKKYCPMQHLLEIKNKNRRQNFFVISNIVSIVKSPSNKTDQNEVNAIRELFQCSRSSSYCQQKRASTKRGHLIAQVKKHQ